MHFTLSNPKHFHMARRDQDCILSRLNIFLLYKLQKKNMIRVSFSSSRK